MGQLSLHDREQTGTLFPMRGEVRIIELREKDARQQSDELKTLSGLISCSQPMYPGIERWFTEKVVPGLKTSERLAYIAYEDENPIASAVLKRGYRSKFCHLKIHKDFQDRDLGQIFFTLMTLQVRHIAKEVYFTLPESLWSEKGGFFRSFAFCEAARASRQYRHGNTELICAAPLQNVWSALVEKLPALARKFSVGGYSLDNKILISVKPVHAEKVLAGKKTVEIRRKFSGKWVGCKVALYASRPVSSLVGEATIRGVTSASPEQIWERFGPSIGCSHAEFMEYSASTHKVSAIELDSVIRYLERVPLEQVSHLVRQELKPPQSYCELDAEKANSWAQAVSVASLLHGSLKQHFMKVAALSTQR